MWYFVFGNYCKQNNCPCLARSDTFLESLILVSINFIKISVKFKINVIKLCFLGIKNYNYDIVKIPTKIVPNKSKSKNCLFL